LLKMPEATRALRIVLYGVGAVGGLIARELLRKKGVEIVGVIDIAKEKVGKDLGEVIKAEEHLGVRISNDAETVLSQSNADVVVHSTSSYLKDIYPQIIEIIRHRINVVSTCEELSYPYISDMDLASKIDELAKKHNVTVLGTGVNPGFLMDTLPIVLTGICQEVRKIDVRRVMNAATRRVPFQKKIGAGLTVEEFKDKMERKIITGHVGLKQSIALIADALGWKLQRIDVNTVEPVIAEKYVRSEAIEVEKGRVAGLRQCAYGIKGGEAVITLDFQAYIGAEEEYDSITIDGIPRICEKISPCVHGDLGTVAIIINSIPKVINASPGLKTMKDLPIPSAALEDIRTYVKFKKPQHN